MNKYVNSETNQHTMKLVQMGADVKVISSKLVYATFILEDNIEVSYVYNVNKKNKYFLERIKPYPLTVKEFDSQEDLITIIKIDLEQFDNAAHSHNVHDFIKIGQSLNQTIKNFEDLFLYYNISKECVSDIHEHIKNINDLITQSQKTSTRVFFKKDPEHLK
ncbi:MAG: hypothetical protein JXR62_03280 [Bacilli bacterium]|nr:hypothetical protein [Bacilli bacterium]